MERNEGTIVSQVSSESRNTEIDAKVGKGINGETLNRAHDQDEIEINE